MTLSTVLKMVSETKYQIIEMKEDNLYFHKVNYIKDSLDVEKHTTYTEYLCKTQLPDYLLKKTVKSIGVWGKELSIELN